MLTFTRLLVAALCLALLTATAAGAAPPKRAFAYDGTFGRNGVSTLPATADIVDGAPTFAFDSSGGLGIGGSTKHRILYFRLDRLGHRDPRFGRRGVIRIGVDASEPVFKSSAIDALGRVLILYETTRKLAGGKRQTAVRLTRLLRDGAVDRSFGNSGGLWFREDRFDQVISIRPGQIRLLRSDDDSWVDDNRRFEILALRENGSVDRAFGEGGLIEPENCAKTPRGAPSEFGWSEPTPIPRLGVLLAVKRCAPFNSIVTRVGPTGEQTDITGPILTKGGLRDADDDGFSTWWLSNPDASSHVLVSGIGSRKILVDGEVDSDAAGVLARVDGRGGLDKRFGVEGGLSTRAAGVQQKLGGLGTVKVSQLPNGHAYLFRTQEDFEPLPGAFPISGSVISRTGRAVMTMPPQRLANPYSHPATFAHPSQPGVLFVYGWPKRSRGKGREYQVDIRRIVVR